MNRMEPGLGQCRPTRYRQLRRTQPEAVPPLREKMKLSSNLRVFERLKVDERVFDMGRIVVLGLKQERRRSLRGRLQRGTYLAIGPAKPARIEDHLEVGTSVDEGCRNIFTLKVRMSTEDRSKMSSSREANNADAIRVNVPLRGVSASEPHSLLRVFHIFDIFRIVTFFRHPILNQNASHTKRVQPIADLSSLNIVSKPDIASSGKDERSSTVVLRRIGRVDSKARFADIRNPNGHFAGDNAVGIGGRIDLKPNHLRSLGITVGPERQRMLLGQSGDSKQQSEKRGRSHGGIVEQIGKINK